VNQSTIQIAHPGELQLDDPDYPAVRVMNEILGGGFASRLFQTVRTDLGLAYAVFGQYGAGYDAPSVFYSGVFTKSESTVEAVQAMQRVIASMQTTPPTPEALALAKDSYLNSFVFNFDTKDEVLRRVLTYDRYGYPADFLQTLKDRIEAVTSQDVQRVAQRYLKPDEAKILVLGRADDFDQPLTALGTPVTIDIAIPTGAPVGPAGDTVAGASALERAANAMGGADRFAALEVYATMTETEVAQGPMAGNTISGTTLMAPPNRMRAQQNTPFGEITVVLNDGQGLLMVGGQSQPAPPQLAAQVRDQAYLSPVFLMTQYADLEAEALAPMDGLDQIRISASGLSTPVTYVLDADGRPVRAMTTAVGPEGPMEVVVEFSDYRDVDGLMLPFRTVQTDGGELSQTTTIQSYDLSPTVAADAFEVE
ncbi:M16 family metallopeptidase, partial [Rubrivirga sp.]|uniref:M16 family metallopeptidase n=1 Tax=Rubrivirga sp. TaxID=1885344 RepID=UPI003C760BB7